MILHLKDDPTGLNPINSVGANATILHNLLFEHLIGLDMGTLSLQPRLAKALPTISQDRRTFSFELREGLQFADGRPLTTKDVEFTFKALMNPHVDSAPRRAELQDFIDVVVHDDLRFDFKVRASGPFNLNRLAIYFYVLPKHIYDPDGLTDAYTARQATLALEGATDSIGQSAENALFAFANFFEDEKFKREKGFVVGSGRYILNHWQTKQSIRLVKNERYWNAGSNDPMAAQYMDTLTYKVIPQSESALAALKAGEIDFSDQFEPEQFRDQMTGERYTRHFEKHLAPYPFYEYIGWNTRIRNQPSKVFFADPQVRRAMSHLIDPKELCETVMAGTARPIASMVWYERPEFNQNLSPYAHDLDKAHQLLEQAGWVDQNQDGIRDKMVNGQLVPFEFTLYYRNGNDVRRRIAQQIKDKFGRSGIKVEIRSLEWAEMLKRLKQHSLDAWLGAWVYDSDEQDLYSLFHSSQILNDGYNWGCYSNPQADTLMMDIKTTWDEQERFQLHREIQQVLYDDQPYTLLFANAARIGYNNRIQTEHWYGQRPCYDAPQFSLRTGKSAE